MASPRSGLARQIAASTPGAVARGGTGARAAPPRRVACARQDCNNFGRLSGVLGGRFQKQQAGILPGLGNGPQHCARPIVAGDGGFDRDLESRGGVVVRLSGHGIAGLGVVGLKAGAARQVAIGEGCLLRAPGGASVKDRGAGKMLMQDFGRAVQAHVAAGQHGLIGSHRASS